MVTHTELSEAWEKASGKYKKDKKKQEKERVVIHKSNKH